MSLEGPIIYYDGTCGFCDRTVQTLMSLDRHRRLTFAPLQGETARSRLPIELRQELKSVVCTDGEETLRYSSAVIRILWRLGGPWKLLAALIWIVPRPIRDAGYRFMARHRYRISGQATVCRLPDKAERAQLLP